MITIWSPGRSIYIQEYLVYPYIRWLEDREKSRSDRITCRTLAAPGSKRLNKSVNPPKTALNEIIHTVTFTSADILTLHSRAFSFFVLNISDLNLQLPSYEKIFTRIYCEIINKVINLTN